jgi:hypothetical protein
MYKALVEIMKQLALLLWHKSRLVSLQADLEESALRMAVMQEATSKAVSDEIKRNPAAMISQFLSTTAQLPPLD